MASVTRPASVPAPAAEGRTKIRPVKTRAEYRACVELQRETWGRSYSDIVPVSIMEITVKMGGLCLGAFVGGGEMLGFVFGVTGPRDGELAHWSHMLAVRGDARNSGIGRRLKLAQRRALAEQGVDTLYWTFDPLVARNAHFNLNRLGAAVIEFVPDMYGATDSDLHQLGTDRFVARWSLKRSERAVRSSAGQVEAGRHPRIGEPGRCERPPFGAEVIEVAVPRDIDQVAARSLDEALEWRCANRGALTRLFAEGYQVVGFRVGRARGVYRMAKGSGSCVESGPGAHADVKPT